MLCTMTAVMKVGHPIQIYRAINKKYIYMNFQPQIYKTFVIDLLINCSCSFALIAETELLNSSPNNKHIKQVQQNKIRIGR